MTPRIKNYQNLKLLDDTLNKWKQHVIYSCFCLGHNSPCIINEFVFWFNNWIKEKYKEPCWIFFLNTFFCCQGNNVLFYSFLHYHVDLKLDVEHMASLMLLIKYRLSHAKEKYFRLETTCNLSSPQYSGCFRRSEGEVVS